MRRIYCSGTRHYDKIKSAPVFGQCEHMHLIQRTQPALGAVPSDRTADFLSGSEPEP